MQQCIKAENVIGRKESNTCDNSVVPLDIFKKPSKYLTTFFRK